MTKRFLPFICMMIALTLAAAPLAAASAALPEGYVYEPWRGDKGGVIAEEISRLNDRGVADTAANEALPPFWQKTAREAGIMGKSAMQWYNLLLDGASLYDQFDDAIDVLYGMDSEQRPAMRQTLREMGVDIDEFWEFVGAAGRGDIAVNYGALNVNIAAVYAIIELFNAEIDSINNSFTRFFVLNYFKTEEGGVALLFYEDGSTEWVLMPEADVNALWGRCGVFSYKNGQPTVNTGTAAALTPPLKYGLLEENLTVEIDGQEITYPKGTIIPIGYDEDNKPFLRLPNGTKILLADVKFTEITSPYTPPVVENNASTNSDDDEDSVHCGCSGCTASFCSPHCPAGAHTTGCPCSCCSSSGNP